MSDQQRDLPEAPPEQPQENPQPNPAVPDSGDGQEGDRQSAIEFDDDDR